MVYGTANVIAQIKLSNYNTDVTHYLINLIKSSLHIIDKG